MEFATEDSLNRKDFPTEDIPVRMFMEDSGITWRYGNKPDYTQANEKFMRERTTKHAPGTLERTVEDLVKTFEMEVTHKTDPKDLGSVDVEKFRLVVNGTRTFTISDVIARGTYNCLLAGNPMYDASDVSFEESHDLFRKAMPDGFPWELLKVLSEPPVVTCTWRHWSQFCGHYRSTPPSGETVEFHGMSIITVSKDLKIEKLEMYFDVSNILQTFNGNKCPLAN